MIEAKKKVLTLLEKNFAALLTAEFCRLPMQASFARIEVDASRCNRAADALMKRLL